jgi:chemotaxis protein methyltransferase CheR
MKGKLAHPSLARGAEIVRDRTGLVFSADRLPSLSSGMMNAMRRAGYRNAEEYLSRLSIENGLLDDLVDDITVGETYFFREPEQLLFIRNNIVPELSEQKAKSETLRVWSAGTASGEEAYSIAIILYELGILGRARVVGTDISHPALARARRGCYGRWSFRGVADDVIDRYFVRTASSFDLMPVIRSAVTFRHLNLADKAPPLDNVVGTGMDLILCRNVLIYLDPETVDRVARRLVMSLADGGWLILGGSDPALTALDGVEVIITSGGLAYRRTSRNDAIAPRRYVAPNPMGKSSFATHPDSDNTSIPAIPDMRENVVAEQPPADDNARKVPPPSIEPPGTSPGPSARLLYAAHQYDRVAGIAGEVVRERPHDIEHWTLLIRALANSGRLAEAGRSCALGMEHHPTSAELAYLHAMLLGAAGHPAEAAAAARRALFLDRKFVMSHLVLAASLVKSGDRAGARRALLNAARLLRDKSPEAPVDGADGEVAGSLASMVQSQLLLVER